MRGLRILPWLQEAKRRGQAPDYLFDCKTCRSETRPDGVLARLPMIRRHMGCGYEPPLENVPVDAWDGQMLGRKPKGDELDERGRQIHPVCAGYVCGLPEVIEISRAYLFLKNGGLSQFVGGDHPTDALLDAVTELECENANVIDWAMKNPVKT